MKSPLCFGHCHDEGNGSKNNTIRASGLESRIELHNEENSEDSDESDEVTEDTIEFATEINVATRSAIELKDMKYEISNFKRNL